MSLEKKLASIEYENKLKLENEVKRLADKMEIIDNIVFDKISRNLRSFLKDIKDNPQKYIKKILNEAKKGRNSLKLFEINEWVVCESIFYPKTVLTTNYYCYYGFSNKVIKTCDEVVDSLQKEINEALLELDHSSLKIEIRESSDLITLIVISW